MQGSEGKEIFSVKTPNDYWQKEIATYYDWPYAWGREIGQNSLDAGAKNINITLTPAKDIQRDPDNEWKTDTCWVVWEDDGCGMDRDDGEGNLIVFSKFLTLGASQKKDGDTGGFGWAKKLICFAMVEWHIRTGTLHIHGEGGQYWTEDNLEYVEGTKMRIRVPAATWRIRRNIEKWLCWTDTKGATVMLDGRVLKTFADVAVKGTRPIPGVDWAKMTVTEVSGQNIIIRANGQMMSTLSGSDDQKYVVVIDVIGKSTDHFMSNRDGLRSKSRNEIQGFLDRLFANPNRISKLDTPICHDYRGGKGAIEIGICDGSGADLSFLLESGIDLVKMLTELFSKERGSAGHDSFDIHVHNEMEGHEIPERFLPGTWDKKAIKMMAEWCALIKFVGEVTGYNGPITPGWVFSPGTTAMHKRGHILLNPLYIDDKTFQVTDRLVGTGPSSDWNSMVTSVVHEFTHAHGYHNHDVRFISAMGMYYAMVMDNAEDLQELRDSFYGC